MKDRPHRLRIELKDYLEQHIDRQVHSNHILPGAALSEPQRAEILTALQAQIQDDSGLTYL